jgi:hypothetical protein
VSSRWICQGNRCSASSKAVAPVSGRSRGPPLCTAAIFTLGPGPIENRVTSLGEARIPQLKNLEAGIVLFGHNWNDEQVLKTQKQNFKWFGWKTPAALSFNWQYTRKADEESPESYLDAIEEFGALLQIGLPR